MEVDNNTPHPSVKPPPLNSDQLNYLIWRYLQESGYAEAAVKLQRDWKIDAEALPFARHVKGQALVTLVQKGLRYHHLSLTVDENGQQTKILEPSMFFFGPETYQADTLRTQRQSLLKEHDINRDASPAITTAPVIPRHRLKEAVSVSADEPLNTPAKRGRKPTQHLNTDRAVATPRKTSTATESELVNGQHNDRTNDVSPTGDGDTAPEIVTNGNHLDHMDVDEDVVAGAGVDDVEMADEADEFVPPPLPREPTLVNGSNKAIQATPAEEIDLGSTTTILSTGSSSSHISNVSWSPTDTNTILAYGEHFCGFWNLEGHDLRANSVKPPPQNVLPSNTSRVVTAVAWHTTSPLIAVATYSQTDGQVYVLDSQDFALVETMSASHRAITLLRWHPVKPILVGLAPSVLADEGLDAATSEILVWNVYGSTHSSIAPVNSSVLGQVFDFDIGMTSDGLLIYVSGEYGVQSYAARDGQVTRLQEYQPKEHQVRSPGTTWTFVKCERRVKQEVVAASADTAAIWICNRGLLRENVHDAPITGLELHPTSLDSNSSLKNKDRFEFATSSIDGSIKIWHIKDSENLEHLFQLKIEASLPIMGLAYSSDGFCLVGAGYHRANIWNAEHEYHLMAKWEGQEHEWHGETMRDDDLLSAGGKSSVNGDSLAATAEHSLAWHKDSKRLVFGLGSQLAIINFER